ncbi:MAG: TlpA disulfide reductase family protein [Pseudomonadota bacterium]
MNFRSGFLAILLCLAAGTGGYALQSYWLGDTPAPVLTADIRFTDLEGKPHTLADYRGKLVLVNFWATWCGPCLVEIPLLVEARKTYGARGLQVLGPAMDKPDAVRAYRDKAQLPYPVFAGDSETAAAMDALGDKLHGLPFSVLISPTGEVLHRQTGEFSREELKQLIETHLK